jgi:aspartyl-tRNA(Asn)/glutamyl-tRNA(Gln) amidotransferase subunit B
MFEDYEIVIGLEVHAEIRTKSKMFCGCSTAFGGEPNSQVCPGCLGLPGSLAVLNKKAVDYGIQTGLALNCEIREKSVFARKNYFYPDLPRAYQISMLDQPLAVNGYIDVNVDGKQTRIRVNRVHLEEDAGKLLHLGTLATTPYSMVDLNRSGIPLMEIVSEPDMRSPEEAKAYLDNLKAILQFIGASDCKMEEGSLRCDANISLRPAGSSQFGTKTEIKNMNSFRAVQKGLEYEAKRQYEAIKSGQRIVQETRAWDEANGVTMPMRSKERAHDYRYFPDPDLLPLIVEKAWVEEVRAALPELPAARKERFVRDYGLPEYDAWLLTSSPAIGDFLDAAVNLYPNPKTVSNWIMGDLMRCLNAAGLEIDNCPVTPEHLTGMLQLMDKGVISGKIAKTVFEEMFDTGKRAEEIVREKGLVQISDESELAGIIDKAIADNPQPLADYLAGKKKALGFFVGQIMKATKGKANPAVVNELLAQKLNEYKK